MTKTKLAVIGDPIAHSLSPVIHTTVLEELGMDFEYEKIRIPKGELLLYLEGIGERGVCGFNATMPHKQDIMQYLDFIDREAVVFDAVNTIKVDGTKLLGYNTDGAGFLRAMEDKGFGCKGKNIVIFGAGGVCSTVTLKVALEGAKNIVVLNRTLGAAESLAENVLSRTGETVITGALESETMKEYCDECDILINGTPLGMEGIQKDFEDFSFLNGLNDEKLVYDLIYKPEKTNLLKEAETRGINILNGLGMLIYQGLLADEIFLDMSLDFDYMAGKIKNNLKKL